jgi:outer membrane receptor for ferrienterochelin and colicin
MSTLLRHARAYVLACAAVLLVLASSVVPVRAADTAVIAGTVIDQQTGLPLSGVAISIVGTTKTATTDARGGFAVNGLPAGAYVVRLRRDGYTASDSDTIVVKDGSVASVTLALQRTAATSSESLKTIANTSVSATASLQRASTIYRTLDVNTLQELGIFRAGDALRLLPGVNNGITGDTAALSDDINLSIRGIGTLETVQTLDGHPIAYGVPGGYNQQLSPIMGLRGITVTYGSGGSENLGVSAIGGVVDFQTINPTPDTRLTLTQGWGTWDKANTNVQATGSLGNRFSYALDWGVSYLDGPIKNSYFPQPGSAFDPSAPPGSYAYPLYQDDSAATNHVGLLKFSYAITPTNHITFTTLNNSMWENKTGNGDGDYLPYAPALAFGKNLLANKASSDPCPSGEFTPLNQFGVPFGTGPNGLPDGGVACETPQQWAKFNTGFDGAGPAWQAINFNDENLSFDGSSGRHSYTVDAFSNRYLDTTDRTFQLPYEMVPGDQASWRNSDVGETGVVGHDGVRLGSSDTFGFGYSYLNTYYNFFKNAEPRGSPVITTKTFLVDDEYRAPGSPLSLYLNANFGDSNATNTSFFDPRLSVIYDVTRKDVVRAAIGATTTQPAGNQVDVPFTESPLGGAGGGKPINCSAPNSIGSAPSTILKPERGVDQELAYGHSFGGDSQMQLALYDVNVFDKLYSTEIPLAQSGTGFIDPTYLMQQEQKLLATCPGVDPAQLLAVTGTVNVGQLRARGFTFSGRQRVERNTFIDYDWTADSTSIISAPDELLKSNETLILGSQLPNLPLHTLDLALDHTFWKKLELRYGFHYVSDNNTKNLPAYNFSTLTAGAPIGPGTFSASVTNLFNQNAFIEGLRYEGVPLALNQYASAADYAQYTGANATEQFGLPYRAVYFTYTFQVH